MYVAGFDEQPLSVSIVGVAEDGHTTYAIANGEPTGTFTDQDGALPHTASQSTTLEPLSACH